MIDLVELTLSKYLVEYINATIKNKTCCHFLCCYGSIARPPGSTRGVAKSFKLCLCNVRCADVEIACDCYDKLLGRDNAAILIPSLFNPHNGSSSHLNKARMSLQDAFLDSLVCGVTDHAKILNKYEEYLKQAMEKAGIDIDYRSILAKIIRSGGYIPEKNELTPAILRFAGQLTKPDEVVNIVNKIKARVLDSFSQRDLPLLVRYKLENPNKFILNIMNGYGYRNAPINQKLMHEAFFTRHFLGSPDVDDERMLDLYAEYMAFSRIESSPWLVHHMYRTMYTLQKLREAGFIGKHKYKAITKFFDYEREFIRDKISKIQSADIKKVQGIIHRYNALNWALATISYQIKPSIVSLDVVEDLYLRHDPRLRPAAAKLRELVESYMKDYKPGRNIVEIWKWDSTKIEKHLDKVVPVISDYISEKMKRSIYATSKRLPTEMYGEIVSYVG